MDAAVRDCDIVVAVRDCDIGVAVSSCDIKDTPDRWLKVAAAIPGKTVSDVIKQYQELEEDVSDIEAGLIPIPGYTSNSFTLEWVNGQGFDGFRQFCGPGGKRGPATRSSDQERKKGVPWTEEEHRQFLMGLKKYGKGDWRSISRNFVTSRTPTQVASHAQKYFIRQLTGGKDKRRSSIHDITTVNITDTKPPSPDGAKTPSPDASNSTMQPQQQQTNIPDTSKTHVQWYLPSEGSNMIFNTLHVNPFMPPPCGISSFGYKLQDQSFHHGGAFHGSQYGAYNAMFPLQSAQHQ
ncbi:SANT/Myb domain [Dillenia turbinata]|uniref:SANT/Myb domain n=1 Tax=Dillenia turbinata TaxID=194707 RepID=A0AAN8W4I7_9MAGN